MSLHLHKKELSTIKVGNYIDLDHLNIKNIIILLYESFYKS